MTLAQADSARYGHARFRSSGNMGKRSFDGATGDTRRARSLGETHLGNAYWLDCGLPHANLGTQILRSACKRSRILVVQQRKVRPTSQSVKSTIAKQQDDDVRSQLRSALILYVKFGSQLEHWKASFPDISHNCSPLRWAINQLQCGIAPLL